MSLYAQMQKNISNYYKMLKEQTSGKYVKETMLGTGIVVGVLVGYFSYNFYVKKREQQAFGALVEVVESFEKAQYELKNSEKKSDMQHDVDAWQDTEVLIDALYKQNSSSYLAPYFLIFKSQIALERGAPVDEVRAVLVQALNQIPKNSALYDLFNLKRIMMALDSSDPVVCKDALADLIAVAKDEKGYSFEEASLVLGSYYVHQGDVQQARQVWENVVKAADKKSLLPSPWVKQAEEKLESIKLA